MTTNDNAAETTTGSTDDQGSGRRPPQPTKTFGQQVWSLSKELVFVLVGAIIVSSLLRAFVGQMFIIPSQSMESTLLIGDRVVVQKITDFERGDVVVFQDPGGWLSDDEPAADATPLDRVLEFIGVPTASTPGHLIKRVIGLPGDRVICCDSQDRITVNGQPLDERSYLFTASDGTQNAPSELRFEVVVPQGRIFVMGDHRDLSADSRCHLNDVSVDQGRGQVAFPPIDLVVGPAFAVVSPLDRAARLRRPATFDTIPAPSEPAPAEAVIKPEGVTC